MLFRSTWAGKRERGPAGEWRAAPPSREGDTGFRVEVVARGSGVSYRQIICVFACGSACK